MAARKNNRQNIRERKRQALELVDEAKRTAVALKVKKPLLDKINTLERNIQRAKLDRDHPTDFCKKEITETQAILSDLKRQEKSFLNRIKWKVVIGLAVFKSVVFLGFYIQSIPKVEFNINPSFYIYLGLIIYLFITLLLYYYYLGATSLFKRFVPILIYWQKGLPKWHATFLSFSIHFCFVSIFMCIYTQFVAVSASTIPKFFSPSLPITMISISNSLIQTLLSAPVAALCVIATILPPLIALLKKGVKRLQPK